MPPGFSGGIFYRTNMTKEIIIKFLNNHCTDAELNEVIQWAKKESLIKKAENGHLTNGKSFQEEDNTGDDEKFSLLFDKIQRKIDIDSQKNKNSKSKISTLSIVQPLGLQGRLPFC